MSTPTSSSGPVQFWGPTVVLNDDNPLVAHMNRHLAIELTRDVNRNHHPTAPDGQTKS